MKLKCSVLITALITALAVFVGTITKSEVKSQFKKRRNKTEVRQNEAITNTLTTETSEQSE